MSTLHEAAQNFREACINFLNCIKEETFLGSLLDYIEKQLRKFTPVA